MGEVARGRCRIEEIFKTLKKYMVHVILSRWEFRSRLEGEIGD